MGICVEMAGAGGGGKTDGPAQTHTSHTMSTVPSPHQGVRGVVMATIWSRDDART